MTRRWALWLIAANLCALTWLVLAWPQLMVAPGPLMADHARISSNCFACHAPFAGASPARCATCHKVADIGIRTTRGVPLRQGGGGRAFHQSLTRADCIACHTDHSRPHLISSDPQRFDHSLLQAKLRTSCASCHRAPRTQVHRMASKSCAACHGTKAWKPVTFDHTRFFALTGPHKTRCTTCHTSTSFERYTCYGCHEHQPAKTRADHAREGIRNIENCARCHRSEDEGEAHNESGEGSDDD